MEHLSFQPRHKSLEPLGLFTQESLIVVHADDSVLIPLQTFQGMPVRLEKGIELGVARVYDLPDQVTIDAPQLIQIYLMIIVDAPQ